MNTTISAYTRLLNIQADLLDLSQLLAASSHVIVAHLVKGLLLVFSLDGISLAVDDRVRGYDTVGGRVRLNHLKYTYKWVSQTSWIYKDYKVMPDITQKFTLTDA